MLTRRGLLAGILGACVAPAIVHNPMRLLVRSDEIQLPQWFGWDIGRPGGDESAIATLERNPDGIINLVRMEIGQIDRFTIHVSPLLPPDQWLVAQPRPTPRHVKKRPSTRW
jgi:hypothetical protein